jgi:hypothetical protein
VGRVLGFGGIMQVGDLVRFRSTGITLSTIGVVIEIGKWTGNTDVKVVWNDSLKVETWKSVYLKVIQ